jgi:hypothetical protein
MMIFSTGIVYRKSMIILSSVSVYKPSCKSSLNMSETSIYMSFLRSETNISESNFDQIVNLCTYYFFRMC